MGGCISNRLTDWVRNDLENGKGCTCRIRNNPHLLKKDSVSEQFVGMLVLSASLLSLTHPISTNSLRVSTDFSVFTF